MNKDMYRLYIVTDGENANNTYVYIDGKLFRGIHKINLNLGGGACKCDMSFYPWGGDKLITLDEKKDETYISETFDSELQAAVPEGEEFVEVIDWRNVLEIGTNGVGWDSRVMLNGEIVKHLTQFDFYQEVEAAPIINFQVWENIGDPNVFPQMFERELDQMPGFIPEK